MDEKRLMKRWKTGRRGITQAYHPYDAAPSKLDPMSIQVIAVNEMQ
jgi:hypothetical protein